MSVFYVSLCRGLSGYYVKFMAPNEDVVREHVIAYFGRLWCSVYTEEYFNQRIRGQYSAEWVINEDRPIILEDAQWE